MQRYLLEITYDGANYFGWQIQPNQRTIQGEIIKKISTLLNQKINLIGCGRTDAGVHAIKYFAHFDSDIEIDFEKFLFRINNFLNNDISINRIYKVHKNFHVRFSANLRTYEYYISCKKDPFLHKISFPFFKDLDLKLLNTGSNFFIGKKDFSSFCKSSSDVNNKICIVTEAFWIKKNNMFIFRITANRFLHNMVRSITGTIIDFALKKISSHELQKIFNSKKRKNSGLSVPAKGLYLINVEYPKNSFSEKNI
tara:strand:- start:20719 stop:21477 length:759 start_codon:yes stop_codon:yes gene_type:complete